MFFVLVLWAPASLLDINIMMMKQFKISKAVPI